jgi:uncharacterized protein (DUF1778 family)
MSTNRTPRDATISFRFDPATRDLIERAARSTGCMLEEFVEEHLAMAAERVLAHQPRFTLSSPALEQWQAMTAGPARELRGLRELMARPSPFVDDA